MAHETAAEFIARKKASIGRTFSSKDIGRKGRPHLAARGRYLSGAGNFPQKVLVVERLRLQRRPEIAAYDGGSREGDIEYRFGYYTVAPGLRRWWWGQYSVFIPAADLAPLIEQARAEGTIREQEL